MINYINIQDLEDFLKAKYEIENYLISSKQIKEKLSIDERKMQEAKQNLEANPTDEQLKAALLNE